MNVSLRRGVIATGFALTAVIMSLVGACFPDLPSPIEPSEASTDAPSAVDASCPAVVEENCTTAINTLECIPQPIPACLRGASATCTCDASAECPVLPSNGCYSRGSSCPDAIVAESSDATCVSLAAQLVPAGTCRCGCPECISVCDGKGTLVYARQGDAGPAVISFVLSQLLPASGALGIYMRVRGYSTLTNIAIVRDGQPSYALPVVVADEKGYTSVFLRPRNETRWGGGTPAPTEVVIATSDTVIWNIDCVVPFYVP